MNYYFGRRVASNSTLLSSSADINNVSPLGNSFINVQNKTTSYKGLSSTIGFSYLKHDDSSRYDLFVGGTYDLTKNVLSANSKQSLINNTTDSLLSSSVSTRNFLKTVDVSTFRKLVWPLLGLPVRSSD